MSIMPTIDRPGDLVRNHSELEGMLGTYGPSELKRIRAEALSRFAQHGVPTTRDEEFKYVSLKVLEDGGFRGAYGATVERSELAALPLGSLAASTLTFVNGQYAPELDDRQALPEGVFVGTLQEAFEAMPERVLEHLGKIATLEGKLGSTNDERFVDLNTAYLGEGAFIFVPKHVEVKDPVHLVFASKADHGPFASHPRVLVVVEEGGRLNLVESYLGLQGLYFTNAVTELRIARHANVEHTRFQYETSDAVHIGWVHAHQDADSVYTSTNAAFGGRIARADVNVWVDGEHAESWLNGVYVGMKDQVVDNHTRIDHAQPNCNSFEVYKGILGGRATGVFNGKIFVYEDAQKTDAKQTNQVILLTPEATINTKPQLEIFADDVKCTHGATVGQLREDAKFYLRSRGVPKRQAEALLVYAFAAEVLEKVTADPVREELEKVLYDKLNETEDLPVE
jgi:Fe-S cluster assembly protein SufD